MHSLLFIIFFSALSFSIASLPATTVGPYVSSFSVRSDRLFENKSSNAAPVKTNVKSLGPRISAQKAIVVDVESGAVLFSKNEDSPHAMASIAKLMSALVFLESNPDLEYVVDMSEEDEREGGEGFIRSGESAKLKDYLSASLIGSANNATIVLSRSSDVTQSEFIDLMNKKAIQIGMRNTKFVDPSGLLSENKSTAYDIVKLLEEVSKNSIIIDIIGSPGRFITVYPSKTRRYVSTTNHLMGSIIFVNFGKTGYLDESLYNLAASVKFKEGAELYIVVLGSSTNEDRVQDAKNLAVWATETYSWEN